MATLRQYFDTDFSNAVRVHVKLPIDNSTIDSVLLYDFTAYTAYLACYVAGLNHNFDFLSKLIENIEYGKTKLNLDGKVILPIVRFFHGSIKIENKENFEILAQFFGDPTWVSSISIQASRRLYLYSETNLTEHEIVKLKQRSYAKGHDLQFRSTEYMNKRTQIEKPLAFICHDSRDKEVIAKKIAVALQKMLCPVWYDEFSLKVGANLRESIEKGLKECKKCILILSPNFFSNKGWTKKEFNSIFTREILEKQNLVLPVWYRVTKEQVYDYSPSLLNIKGISWEELGEDDVCRQLNREITN